jgi:hypothetical protein
LPKIHWQSVFFRRQTYFLTKWNKKPTRTKLCSTIEAKMSKLG